MKKLRQALYETAKELNEQPETSIKFLDTLTDANLRKMQSEITVAKAMILLADKLKEE